MRHYYLFLGNEDNEDNESKKTLSHGVYETGMHDSGDMESNEDRGHIQINPAPEGAQRCVPPVARYMRSKHQVRREFK
jgi:hypothetical protein